MKKRILAILLATVMVCALLPTVALAAEVTVTEVIPCKYGMADPFSEGLAAVRDENGKWGFIDKTGKEVVPCKYDQVDSDGFCEGLVWVELNGKFGFIDTTGKEVTPIQYDNVGNFAEGLAPVELNGKWSVIDKTGKAVISCKYSAVLHFSEGLAAVMDENDKWGFIDKTGTEVVPLGKYDQAGAFSEGLARVQKNWMIGYIDKTGKEVIPCALEYVEAGDFSEGLAWVCDENSWMVGYIDKTGKEVVPCKYTSAWFFSEGLAAVDVGDYEAGKWGFISVSGSATPTTNTAYASTQTVNVDGKAVTFECYALKDQSGNATNYIKLRDLAMLLNGSAAQFQVGWDGSVTITTKTAYTPNGSELSTPYSGDRAYQETTATTKVNGQAADLAAFVLNDDNGGGYTYYQLRDLGKALGFNVGWAADKGIFLETDKPYAPGN